MTHGAFDIDDESVPPAGHVAADADEFDPLAAPRYSAEEAGDEAADEHAGGFADSDRIVRVWVENDRITRVRVSPVWFHKITGEDTLENHFREALAPSTVRIASLDDPVDTGPDVAETLRTLDREALVEFNQLPRLSNRTLIAFSQLFDDQNGRIERAIARAENDDPESRPVVTGRSQGVIVTLNDEGLAESVDFDEDWLDDNHVGAISTHVVAAAADAYARYLPVDRTNAELDDLMEERALLHAAYRAMINPRRDYR